MDASEGKRDMQTAMRDPRRQFVSQKAQLVIKSQPHRHMLAQ